MKSRRSQSSSLPKRVFASLCVTHLSRPLLQRRAPDSEGFLESPEDDTLAGGVGDPDPRGECVLVAAAEGVESGKDVGEGEGDEGVAGGGGEMADGADGDAVCGVGGEAEEDGRGDGGVEGCAA